MFRIFGIFSLIALLLDLNEKKHPETQIVINIFRHGARTPKHYVSEVEKIFKKYPAGSLTDNGWRMQFLLGRYLRRRLPPNFISKPSEFLLISSYKERAINSGISFASGLINEMFQMINFDRLIGKQHCGVCKQLSFTENINNDLVRQNIIYREKFKYPPIKNIRNNFSDYLNKFQFMIVSHHKDMLFHARSCKFKKKYNYSLGKPRSKHYFSDITFEEHNTIFNFLKSKFNQTLSNITDSKEISHLDIKNYYLILRSLDFEKPGFIQAIDQETEEAFYKVIFDYYYKKAISSSDQARVVSSMFFDHLIYFFDSKIGFTAKNKHFHHYNNYKVVSYSGHDYNILGLINNLYGREFLFSLDKSKNKGFLFSSYSSSVEFHLIKTSPDEFYVRIYYNGHEPYYPLASFFDDKGALVKPVYYRNLGIQYKTFKKMLKSLIFPNYDKCHIKSPKSKYILLMKVLKIKEFFNIRK